jgi:threonine/homoserine/homoserine lactone efflux protein
MAEDAKFKPTYRRHQRVICRRQRPPATALAAPRRFRICPGVRPALHASRHMPDITSHAVFFVASAVLIITPGPAVLYILARSVSQGRRAGLVSVAGVGLANLGHAVAASLGLSAILAASTLAYSMLKYIGAAYLMFLGLRKILGRAPTAAPDATPLEPLRATFRQALLVGILNPKTALFFLSFLPQFAHPGHGPVSLQLLVLGVSFVAMAVISDGAYALLSGTLARYLRRRDGFVRAGRYASGAVYCGLGVIAALSGHSHAS